VIPRLTFPMFVVFRPPVAWVTRRTLIHYDTAYPRAASTSVAL